VICESTEFEVALIEKALCIKGDITGAIFDPVRRVLTLVVTRDAPSVNMLDVEKYYKDDAFCAPCGNLSEGVPAHSAATEPRCPDCRSPLQSRREWSDNGVAVTWVCPFCFPNYAVPPPAKHAKELSEGAHTHAILAGDTKCVPDAYDPGDVVDLYEHDPHADTLGDLREHVDTLAQGFCSRFENVERCVADMDRRVVKVECSMSEMDDEMSEMDDEIGKDLRANLDSVEGCFRSRFNRLECRVVSLAESQARLAQRVAAQGQRVPLLPGQLVYINDGPRLVPCYGTGSPPPQQQGSTCAK
jgi:hypothetical protein